jgi:glutamate carboxypeptidase
VARFTLEVEGIAAHAGNAHLRKGRSAILEMAHKVIDVQNLTDWEEGTTFNVGTIQGGTVPNAIPDYAKVEIDIRFQSLDKEDLNSPKQLQEIAAKTYVEGTKTKLSGGVVSSARWKQPKG